MKPSHALFVVTALAGSALAAAGCAGDDDKPAVAAQTSRLAAAEACLIEPVNCGPGCTIGNVWSPPSPGSGFNSYFRFFNIHDYGSEACPGTYVLEVLNPSVLSQSSYGTVYMTPSMLESFTEEDCASASVGLSIYRHTADGWETSPWAQQEWHGAWMTNGGTCGFGTVGRGFAQSFGGLSGAYDKLRIELGGQSESGVQVPFSTSIVSCTPKTCASAGVTCGNLEDGCGGTVNCGACAARLCSTSASLVCRAAGNIWDQNTCTCRRR